MRTAVSTALSVPVDHVYKISLDVVARRLATAPARFLTSSTYNVPFEVAVPDGVSASDVAASANAMMDTAGSAEQQALFDSLANSGVQATSVEKVASAESFSAEVLSANGDIVEVQPLGSAVGSASPTPAPPTAPPPPTPAPTPMPPPTLAPTAPPPPTLAPTPVPTLAPTRAPGQVGAEGPTLAPTVVVEEDDGESEGFVFAIWHIILAGVLAAAIIACCVVLACCYCTRKKERLPQVESCDPQGPTRKGGEQHPQQQPPLAAEGTAMASVLPAAAADARGAAVGTGLPSAPATVAPPAGASSASSQAPSSRPPPTSSSQGTAPGRAKSKAKARQRPEQPPAGASAPSKGDSEAKRLSKSQGSPLNKPSTDRSPPKPKVPPLPLQQATRVDKHGSEPLLRAPGTKDGTLPVEPAQLGERTPTDRERLPTPPSYSVSHGGGVGSEYLNFGELSEPMRGHDEKSPDQLQDMLPSVQDGNSKAQCNRCHGCEKSWLFRC